jgi:Tol biopolymer transport system component
VWSPDGRSLAFVRDGEVWLSSADGGEEQEPRWSPDGRFLAFRAAPAGGEILAIAPDGSNERTIGLGFQPKWSPDGQRIAFTYGSGFLGFFGGLATMRVDGSEVALLADVFYSDALPGCLGEDYEWSPDSRLLAYWSEGLNAGSLAVVSADGSSEPINLGEGLGPTWSADSRQLAYSAPGRGFLCTVYTVDANGGQPSLLVEGAVAPRWSPDGRLLVIGFGRPPSLSVIVPPNPGLVREFGLGARPRWSPDSSRLAFYRPADPSQGGRISPPELSERGSIVVEPLEEGSAPTVEIAVEGFLGDYCWSPDGRSLAYAVSRGGESTVYVVSLDQPASPRRLTTGSFPSWSPDGRTIVFSRYY